MREIKFRAWDASAKRMNNKVLIGNATNPDKDDYTAHCIWIDDEWLNFDEHSDIVIEQFTGLKDCNGVDIYESDLIQNESGRVCSVVYNKFTAGFDAECDKTSWIDTDSIGFRPSQWSRFVKVIGNIHQNKELVES